MRAEPPCTQRPFACRILPGLTAVRAAPPVPTRTPREKGCRRGRTATQPLLSLSGAEMASLCDAGMGIKLTQQLPQKVGVRRKSPRSRPRCLKTFPAPKAQNRKGHSYTSRKLAVLLGLIKSSSHLPGTKRKRRDLGWLLPRAGTLSGLGGAAAAVWGEPRGAELPHQPPSVLKCWRSVKRHKKGVGFFILVEVSFVWF